MNKRHYEHTLPNIRGSLSNTYVNTVFPLQFEQFDMLYFDVLPLVLSHVVNPRNEDVHRSDTEKEEHCQQHCQPLSGCDAPAQAAELFVRPILYFCHAPAYHRFCTLMSLFSIISKASMVKPCGLLSERTEFSRLHLVTRLRSVTLLSRIIICRA